MTGVRNGYFQQEIDRAHSGQRATFAAPNAPTATAASSASTCDATRNASLDTRGRTAELGADELRKRADASRIVHTVLGDLVHLMLQVPQQKARPLGDLEWAIVPGVLSGQFAMVHAQNKTNGVAMPVAAVLWARVSADVDRRLSDPPSQPLRLTPAEWTSGDIHWLVEAIGDQRVITNVLQGLRTKQWAGKTVKMKIRAADGTVTIQTLDQVVQQAGQTAPAAS